MLVQDKTLGDVRTSPPHSVTDPSGDVAGEGLHQLEKVGRLAKSARASVPLAPTHSGKFANWPTLLAPAAGGTTHPTNTAKRESITLPEVWRRKHLTPAEQRVVELIGSGRPTKIVAAELDRSPLTVRNQLTRAMKKLGVANRYELMAKLRPLSAPVCAEVDTSFAYAI